MNYYQIKCSTLPFYVFVRAVQAAKIWSCWTPERNYGRGSLPSERKGGRGGGQRHAAIEARKQLKYRCRPIDE